MVNRLRVKMILPALTEAKSPYWRSIKYSLFPPLGLATLAGYLDPDDEVDLQDEHVERLRPRRRPPARRPRRPPPPAPPARAPAPRPPAGAAGPHQARALPGAELPSGEPRLPA